jgi:hypothetical protein
MSGRKYIAFSAIAMMTQSTMVDARGRIIPSEPPTIELALFNCVAMASQLPAIKGKDITHLEEAVSCSDTAYPIRELTDVEKCPAGPWLSRIKIRTGRRLHMKTYLYDCSIAPDNTSIHPAIGRP